MLSKAWLSNYIEKEFISKLSNKGPFLRSGFIMGGAVVSTHEGKPPNDLDVYFENLDDLKLHLDTNYKLRLDYERLADGTYGRKAENQEQLPFRRLLPREGHFAFAAKTLPYVTQNAVTVSRKVQVITKFIGTPEEVASTYDFEHCKAYWRPNPAAKNPYESGEITYLGNSLECISNKHLSYNAGATYYKLCAMIRMLKFTKRGWEIDPGSLLALAKDLQTIDLTNPDVLAEQLKGFYNVPRGMIDAVLKEHKEPNEIIEALKSYY